METDMISCYRISRSVIPVGATKSVLLQLRRHGEHDVMQVVVIVDLHRKPHH
ncbi:MAG: hypothetical protein HY694_09450 [Deltaproteobacteria bacterium]|nr:hypothetical protein [Deltaproteobacteria bacterium]